MPNFLNCAEGIIADVFYTMAGLRATIDKRMESVAFPIEISGVTGVVSLIGKFNGIIYVSFTEALAMMVSERILGTKTGPGAEEEVNDVVGELTNMIGGNLKSRLGDRGYNCQLSIPTVLRGRQILVDAKEAKLACYYTFRFSEIDEILTIQVCARWED